MKGQGSTLRVRHYLEDRGNSAIEALGDAVRSLKRWIRRHQDPYTILEAKRDSTRLQTFAVTDSCISRCTRKVSRQTRYPFVVMLVMTVAMGACSDERGIENTPRPVRVQIVEAVSDADVTGPQQCD